MIKLVNLICTLVVSTLAVYTQIGCQSQLERNEVIQPALEINSMSYVTDTNYLIQIMNPDLVKYYHDGDISISNLARRYLKVNIANHSTDTIVLTGFPYKTCAMDTLLTISLKVFKFLNATSDSFELVPRPEYISDYFQLQDIEIPPQESVQRLMEDDTQLDLSGKKVSVIIWYEKKVHQRLISSVDTVMAYVSSSGLN